MSPSFRTLKHLSFTHSAIYAVLLAVWLIPGLHTLEFIFGMAHGLGWIAMCVLALAALRARVISLRLGVAVAIIGAIGPFVGSYEFVREEHRRGRKDETNRAGQDGRACPDDASVRTY